ncbi:Prostaglandin reductase 1 [Melipona quadrifasciata]|uniref:Prostaglandin reductase 1 n=1 Tax=Melipona quadrifasciata TaxID=166423 RepID=A0A0N0BDE4_9HYME|nr:Prostaglandin reductase 1 [Melipona quadrifasciata]
MIKAKKFIVVKHFQNEPKPSDLRLVEEELPALQNGEFLVQAEYLSVDPYMRVYTQRYPIGITMIGSQVAIIIESKNTEFPVGKRIVGHLGWRTHTIVNPHSSEHDFLGIKPMLIPDIDLSPSLYLGVLHMPGSTAYFGLLDICRPKQDEVLVVSGAGGAIGSHVGQIAKILGLTVIGITDSDEKCKWLVEELGFDYAIDYKKEDVEVFLKKAAPEGIDCYFDNVGGEISTIVMYQMKNYGRIAACGCIALYNTYPSSLPKSTVLQPPFVFNRLKMEGFLITDWYDRWHESEQKNLQWIREGKLLYRETITKGFENMFDAFVGMLQGKNIGKALVQA